MDNLKCVLLVQRLVTKTYTVPKDKVGEEWTYRKSVLLPAPLSHYKSRRVL